MPRNKERPVDTMADNKEYITNNDTNGKISISEDVIASIASFAAKEIDGVLPLTSAGDEIAEIFGKKNVAKGVKVQLDENSVAIGMGIRVRHGVKVPEIALTLQRAVIQAVETYAGLAVSSVNIYVGGIDFGAKSEAAED